VGLGIRIDAPIAGALDWHRLERAFLGELPTELRPLVRFVRAEGGLDFWLHPGTEPVELRAEGGVLTCSAKTNPAGPGYHAYLVELLERVAPEAGLSWRWADADGDLGDECGYHASRDFVDLQRQMLAWLQGMCRYVLEDLGDASNIGVCMPIGLHPQVEATIHSPMGLWSQPWVAKVAEGEDGLLSCGAEFFPWWSRELDASFWHNVGMVLAWIDIPWHPPADARERETIDHALAAFARARALEPQRLLPDLDLAELQRMRDGDPEDPTPPRPDGIGFRRGLMAWQLAGRWSIRLPGYWYDTIEDGIHVLWYRDRTVHATPFGVDGARRDKLVEYFKPSPAGGEIQSWRSGELVARCQLRPNETEGEDGWVLQGMVVGDGGFLNITMTYLDPADHAWALQTFKTIRR
jgi:hypothetical protein